MSSVAFNVVPGTDKEYVDTFLKLRADGLFNFDKVTLGHLSDLPSGDLAANTGIQEVLDQGVRSFPNFTFRAGDGASVSIHRPTDQSTLFDKVSVHRHDRMDQVQFAKLVAVVQRSLKPGGVFDIGNLLGPAATKHFEAREIALARLETTASNLLGEMETARREREREFQAKERELNDLHEKRRAELEDQAKRRQEQLDQQATELDALRKELDDRAAKHARRQHYKDIKTKFQAWGEQFNVTAGTTGLRQTVYWFTVLLLLAFGSLALWFLFQSFSEQDTTRFVAAVVKQVAFTVLFVSTAFFFIRWNNQWFMRHAEEEFRLKRMELDIDRASWFVEMAFEWQDEKGEPIPVELVERLTHGLFADGGADHAVEPADSLLQALVGAARFKVKLGDGTEVEYDRKGVERLVRERRKAAEARGGAKS